MDKIEVETTTKLYAIISSPTKRVDNLYFLIKRKDAIQIIGTKIHRVICC